MKTTIGRNIRKIRIKLNLSVKRYSELTGISRTTIVNIEQGHTGIKLNTINSLIDFTDYSIEDISSSNFNIDQNLVQNLFKKYRNDNFKRQFFMYTPKIHQAINEQLLPSDFFQTFREINEIVKYLTSLGFNVKGTSLQNELKKHKNIEMTKHTTKRGTNIYKVKI